MPHPPVARVDDQVADRPALLIDDPALHVADLAVLRLDVVARDIVA